MKDTEVKAPTAPSTFQWFYDAGAKAFNRARLYLRPPTLIPAVLTASFIYAVLSYSRQRPIVASIVLFIAHRLHYTYTHHPQMYQALHRSLYNMAKVVPAFRRLMDNELQPIIRKLEEDKFKDRQDAFRFLELPDRGISEDRIIEELHEMAQIKGGEAAKGSISGAIYSMKGDFHRRIGKELVLINVMHDHLWPRLTDAENQSVQMCLRLYDAPESAWGKTTAGGTLSIYEAVSAYKGKADAEFNTSPHMILSDRAHPAFKKAAEKLGISWTEIPVNPVTYQVDLRKMESAITPNTVLLVASAPTFPEGIMDDIEGVSNLALKYGIGCHMDACLGGGMLPFAKGAGLELPPCSFKLPGVTTISMDLHKYGEAPKGHSVVMYRTAELAKYSMFVDLQSKMGMYGSMGIEGSRPSRAAGWALMLSMGVEGFTKNLKAMLAIKDTIVQAIQIGRVSDVQICGDPKLPIFAVKSTNTALDIFIVATRMNKVHGWSLHALPEPAFHLCITPVHIHEEGFAERFIDNLKESINWAMKHPEAVPSSELKMYNTFKTDVPGVVARPVLEEVGQAYFELACSAERRYTK